MTRILSIAILGYAKYFSRPTGKVSVPRTEPRVFSEAGLTLLPCCRPGPPMQPREIFRTAAYHSHPHWQRTEWLRWRFSITFLHAAHNLIHITLLPIRPEGFPPRDSEIRCE